MDGKKVIVSKKTSFKTVLRNIKKLIIKLFKKIINKYNSLDSFYKKIVNIWAIGLVILIIFLSFVGVSTKDVNNYIDWENKIKDAGLEYAKDNEIYTNASKPLIVSYEVLVENGYLNKAEIPNKSCTGYARVIYSLDEESENGEGEFKVSSYINCKKYTTEGYSENK